MSLRVCVIVSLDLTCRSLDSQESVVALTVGDTEVPEVGLTVGDVRPGELLVNGQLGSDFHSIDVAYPVDLILHI